MTAALSDGTFLGLCKDSYEPADWDTKPVLWCCQQSAITETLRAVDSDGWDDGDDPFDDDDDDDDDDDFFPDDDKDLKDGDDDVDDDFSRPTRARRRRPDIETSGLTKDCRNRHWTVEPPATYALVMSLPIIGLRDSFRWGRSR